MCFFSKARKLVSLMHIVASSLILFSCASSSSMDKKPDSEEVALSSNSSSPSFSSSSSKKAEKNSAGSEKGSDAVVLVSKSSMKPRSFFASVGNDVLSLAELGAPESFRQMGNLMHKSDFDLYTDQEKTLLYIAQSIMSIVWKSEKYALNVSAPEKTNQYVEIIESAKNGIFDLSSSNSDFFSLVLPTLVLFTSENSSREYDGKIRESLENAYVLNGESVLLNYLLGTYWLRNRDYEKAMSFYNASNTRYAQGNKEVFFSIAKTCYLCGNAEIALSIGEELARKFPQDTEILRLCAESAYSLNDFSKTESYVVRILLLEPENIDYILLRVRILMAKGDFIRSSSLLDVCQKKNPLAREYLILRAKLQRDWNKNEGAALETITVAVQNYPDDEETLVLAAELASLTGNAVMNLKASDLIQKVLEKNPENFSAVRIYIKELRKIGNERKAYELSSKLSSSSDAAKDVLYEHVDICLALQKYQEASVIVKKLYDENPDDEECEKAYIKVLVHTGRNDEAMKLISSLLPFVNSKFKSFLYYQRSYLQVSENLILADLRSSLTSNPRNKDSLYRLYKIYFNKSDWRRAQYYLKQVVALDPSNSLYLSQNSELDRKLKR